MIEIVNAWKKIMEIAGDGKVTKDELPELLAAVVALIGGIVALITPFLSAKTSGVAKNISRALELAKK